MPRAVFAGTLTVNVVLVVAGFGEKVPVAPLGAPETLKLTLPVKPPLGVIVTE